ncbi:inhibitor of growth protein 1 [Diabrotica virgifera virgifera]|uniref:Inhibitor of growth protein n=1 Tax=Diabrotica virgifera virgifera TaxID=50390 RepID=A0A6P7FX24_DIAVI|nr:inhibitor of growth protein 1 [Diabrotica virgifera virgifera]
MLNQVSVEAVYSATYVENYLDCVENLPDEVQRLISRMRELDVIYLARLREVAIQTENMGNDNHAKKAKSFLRMQQSLIAAQELGDEKMSLLQAILDKIEIKTRLLDQDLKNLDFGKEEQTQIEIKEQQSPLVNTPINNNNGNNTSTNNNNSNSVNNDRPAKRARRTRHDTYTGAESNDAIPVEHVLRSQVPATTPTNTVQQKKTSTSKKKKRKSRQNTQIQKEETPPRDEEPLIDPDEPTYCLCDQISYGEMIMCDNDLCPIEWFHFSCVTLSTKPKGKWYCPKCRGDRPNVMKPKAQFLRELEKYNKEKEEKT